VHVGALLYGGGFAVASDRLTRDAARSTDAHVRTSHLAALARVHPIVTRALWASLASGGVLFALHVERYVTSGIFWSKMALLVALVVTGLAMRIAERDEREAGASESREALERIWRRLRGTAVASTTLWTLVAIAGVLLEGAPAAR
jgi:hypothetical protein